MDKQNPNIPIKTNTEEENIEDKNIDEQIVNELLIRNQYLRKQIQRIDKLKREYRDEIYTNNDIMLDKCNHEWQIEERTCMYDKLYFVCRKCGCVK